MVRIAAVVAVLCGACGGGEKKEDTLPDDEGGGEVVADDTSGGDMIPPERMDAIQHELDRKRGVATRCLTEAIDAGEADKNARGKITVEFVITTTGQARDVQVIKSTIDSKMVDECVADVVRKIDFGSLSKDLEWSYTYAFEAF